MTHTPIHRITEDLFLVDLDLSLTGFRQFISSWVLTDDGRAIVVDPGPSSTVPVLSNALKELGIKTIDSILLTHIHLDHAGGCGDLIRQYPNTTIVCHPQAVAHLVDPARLWLGSVKVLGDLARTYGEPSPVTGDRLCTGCTIQWKGHEIESLETPGHASHHLCFFLDDIVFAGEVAGIRVPSTNPAYARPATPPPFHPETALSSLSKVIEKGPQRMCYAHYGMVEHAVSVLEDARSQISLWLEIIEERRTRGLAMDEEKILNEILARDPGVRSFPHLEPDIQERERYFLKNSIKGMAGSLKAQS
jgi:glyoxylase-like metal-dependent hydrolase (beta-lactamase superfamily II)